MSDDDLIEEYQDFSKRTTRSSELDDEDKALLKDLNLLRYKFDKNYISAENFYKKIDCQEFIGFLTNFEENEIKRYKFLENKSETQSKGLEASTIFTFFIIVIIIFAFIIILSNK